MRGTAIKIVFIAEQLKIAAEKQRLFFRPCAPMRGTAIEIVFIAK